MELLRGVIRNYDWGDPEAIAELLGLPAPGHPQAEYWLGAHHSAPSTLVETGIGLDRLVARDPTATLGPRIAARFGGFPFLLKILAAATPLSIQAHPSPGQAEAGFEAESSAGIELGARDRNYRDDRHKPELICAITPFEAKCGFRSVADSRLLIGALAACAEAGPLVELAERLEATGPEADVLAETVAWLLLLPVERKELLVDAVVAAAGQLSALVQGAADGGGSAPPVETFWPEIDWTGRIAAAFPGDIGVVVALLLNHVSLAPGQAMFLSAGNLHSYLRGVGVELMANSDNVVRGGLTSKHIDVDQLLDVVDYRPGAAPIQTPAGPVHRFETPAPEFGLTRLDATAGDLGRPSFEIAGPEIVLVTAGELVLASNDRQLALDAGSACFICHADRRYSIHDRRPGVTVAWRATVGAEPAP